MPGTGMNEKIFHTPAFQKNEAEKVPNTQHATLVGGFNPFEKYDRQNWIISPNRDENKKYLKPPTRTPLKKVSLAFATCRARRSDMSSTAVRSCNSWLSNSKRFNVSLGLVGMIEQFQPRVDGFLSRVKYSGIIFLKCWYQAINIIVKFEMKPQVREWLTSS